MESVGSTEHTTLGWQQPGGSFGCGVDGMVWGRVYDAYVFGAYECFTIGGLGSGRSGAGWLTCGWTCFVAHAVPGLGWALWITRPNIHILVGSAMRLTK